jgi:hypothetical protein
MRGPITVCSTSYEAFGYALDEFKICEAELYPSESQSYIRKNVLERKQDDRIRHRRGRAVARSLHVMML